MCFKTRKKRKRMKQNNRHLNDEPSNKSNKSLQFQIGKSQISKLNEMLNTDVETSPYIEHVKTVRQTYSSYFSQYRSMYRQKSLSLSKISNKCFTEIIKLPTSEHQTAEQVLESKGYKFDKRIGKGGYGVVYKTRYKNQTVACKVINLRKSSYNRMINHLKVEIYILERCPHPNIITLYDHFIIDDNAYIVMEFADAGSLADIVERLGYISEPQSRTYFIQTIKGLFFMHMQGLAHRDMKLDNILMVNHANDRNKTKIIKLTDFGLSQAAFFPKEGRIKTGNFGGTRSYMAPEIIRLDTYDDFDTEQSLEYDPFKADIWALGICLYEMLAGSVPFDTLHFCNLYKAQVNRSWKFPSNRSLSAPLKHLIEDLLEPDPVKRIDPIGILLSEWVQEEIGLCGIARQSVSSSNDKKESDVWNTLVKFFST